MERAPKLKYTAQDYLSWNDGKRWELIDGAAYAMSPSPTRGHQSVTGDLFVMLYEFLKGKPCKPVIAPYDVKLDQYSVVQPDISVWCRKDTEGKPNDDAPETLTVVIEVLSPSTASHDLVNKRQLYEKHQIPEYWIVSPEEKSVTRFSLRGGSYIPYYFHAKDAGKDAAKNERIETEFSETFISEVLPGFSFGVEAYFAQA